MTEETGRLDRVSHFQLTLPAHHVVWSVAASPGSTVSEGQTVLDLADCEHRFVVVELPEREFEKIKAGTPALVRLIGSNDWTQGPIQQVRGSAARADDRLLAAQVQRPDPGSITVEIGLPEDDAQADRNNFCNIGRLAEVRFQRAGFAFLDSVGRSYDSSSVLLKPRPLTSRTNKCVPNRSPLQLFAPTIFVVGAIYLLGPLLPVKRSWARIRSLLSSGSLSPGISIGACSSPCCRRLAHGTKSVGSGSVSLSSFYPFSTN